MTPTAEIVAAIDETLAPRREAYQKYISLPVEDPLSVERAELLYVFDSYGHQYLDLSSGGLLNPLGHCNQAVCTSILDHINHYGATGSRGHLLRYQAEYAQALSESLPEVDGAPQRVLFCESERDALLTALKLALESTADGVNGVVSVGSYYWARMLSNCREWLSLSELEPVDEDRWSDSGVLLLDLSTSPDKLWVQQLVDQAKQHEVMVVVDESRTGFGRTGTLWAHTQWSVDPDLVVMGGPLGGGLPLGAVIGYQGAYHIPESIGAGNPISCGAGLAGFSQIHEGILEHVKDAGGAFEDAINDLRVQFPHFISGQRGTGLLRAVEFHDRLGGPSITQRFWSAATASGLLLDHPGFGKRISYTPPLIISENEVRRSVDIMASVLMDWEPL